MTIKRAGIRRAKKKMGRIEKKRTQKNRNKKEDRMVTYDRTVNRQDKIKNLESRTGRNRKQAKGRRT
jgi:hypothetical protein